MLDINEQGLGLLIPLLFTLGAYVSISQTSLLWPKSHKNVDPAKNNRRINVSRLIFSALIIYTSVFHALANLPLSSAMPRMVHQRFWMQAHLIIFWFSGIGIGFVLDFFFLDLSNKVCFYCVFFLFSSD